jgi:hypothetical protein
MIRSANGKCLSSTPCVCKSPAKRPINTSSGNPLRGVFRPGFQETLAWIWLHDDSVHGLPESSAQVPVSCFDRNKRSDVHTMEPISC